LKILKMTALVLALVAPAATAHAGESISLILNWTPAADHSPFYDAKAQGWFEKRTIT
jgi:NitT/TauT family transport system substrate-binding protein